LSDLTFLKLEYCADAKPETKSDSMLVWAAHYDPEIDKRSMLLNCQIQLLLCAC